MQLPNLIQYSNENQINEGSFKWEQGIVDHQVVNFNHSNNRYNNIIIQLKFTQEGEILYIYDGSILRKEKVIEISQKPQLLNNIEQIKFLEWMGNYGTNNQKIGRWTILWKGTKLKDIGGEYSQEGKKQGLWREITKNYRKNAEVLEIGVYENDYRKGYWKYIYQQNDIGGGQYCKLGIKNGTWTEICDGFELSSQIIYIGEYLDGKKIGKWNILFRQSNQYEFKQIGGGLYIQEGDGTKIGNWIELDDEFNNKKQVTYQGEYLIGKKVGRWSVNFRHINEKQFNQIGGGSYEQENSIKFGKWTEISEGFNCDSQVIQNGEYKNGKKVGLWDYQFHFRGHKLIGGGLYDQNGKGDKFGKWIDLDRMYKWNSQVTYSGQYQIGKKVGKWDTWYKDYENSLLIGGGFYDDRCAGNKVGKWIELDNEFMGQKLVTYTGQYINDKKVGRWDIWHKHHSGNHYKQIGGGSYDSREEHMKIGKWIILCDEFSDSQQVVFNGEYFHGKKVGLWDILYWCFDQDQYKLIGGGIYNKKDCQKIGNWIELDDLFVQQRKVLFKGEYLDGKKVGKWDIWYKHYNSNEFKLIGGGSYDIIGSAIKLGKWIELDEGFYDRKQVTYAGQYKAGVKNGRWDTWYQQEQQNEKIGGGLFKEGVDNMKIGQWIELDDEFSESKQITYQGVYVKGYKVGYWDINFKKQQGDYKIEKIGGGSFTEIGDCIKIGKWVEISNRFWIGKQVIYVGEYKKGRKIGLWFKMKRSFNQAEFKISRHIVI
ncbi:unnamed protein product [Paramecium octaurelia]|uniref:Uncharacterized protein n=1 Tax=Paramecium octaurelia TaxID=43137 RepID=A0A8S1WZS0_PAROT|nr:unnamed protein product [Paramecium octaurelia]